MWKILLYIQKPIKFDSGLPKFITYLSQYINYNYIDNTTQLHRWCHINSEKYKTICDWEKKSDNANRDNSL